MTINPEEYFQARLQLLNDIDRILELEHHYMHFLANAIRPVTSQISSDFDMAIDFFPFWKNYPPLQRGRAPTGLSVPWQEVGETVVGPHVIYAIHRASSDLNHPGLPSGADIRFLTPNALIHLDIKVTGPNDRADEVVASPNQISGDGIQLANSGVVNSSVVIRGRRAVMRFQPELAPFYIVRGKTLPCLTFFLKVVYTVQQLGHQPLSYIELISGPNGLLAFDGPHYNETVPGLFIPGKDDITTVKKRVRLRMEPLGTLHVWRRQIIYQR